jgi:DNA topoisomerase-1
VKRVAAQEARRVLDRLVGYIGQRRNCNRQSGERLSAGRVQSPAVRLVVERERQIRAFKVTNHFGAIADFRGRENRSEWFATEWLTKPDFVTDDNPYFMDRAFAAAVADVKAQWWSSSFVESEAKRSPPPPFTTSTMQQAASVALGLDPKAAMDAAQKLYEQGHISYHRTDNPNVSDECAGRHFRGGGQARPGHGRHRRESSKRRKGRKSAIRRSRPRIGTLRKRAKHAEQRALYKLIRLRAIACQLADARYAVRTVRLDAGAQPVNAACTSSSKAKGRTLTYSGWLKLMAGDQTEDEERRRQGFDEPDSPARSQASAWTCCAASCWKRRPKPPARLHARRRL